MYTIDYKYSQLRHWFLIGKKTQTPKESCGGRGGNLKLSRYLFVREEWKPQTPKVPWMEGLLRKDVKPSVCLVRDGRNLPKIKDLNTCLD